MVWGGGLAAGLTRLLLGFGRAAAGCGWLPLFACAVEEEEGAWVGACGVVGAGGWVEEEGGRWCVDSSCSLTSRLLRLTLCPGVSPHHAHHAHQHHQYADTSLVGRWVRGRDARRRRRVG